MSAMLCCVDISTRITVTMTFIVASLSLQRVSNLNYLDYELRFTVYGEPGFCAFLRVQKPIIVRTPELAYVNS
jgi:hypothetical protein